MFPGPCFNMPKPVVALLLAGLTQTTDASHCPEGFYYTERTSHVCRLCPSLANCSDAPAMTLAELPLARGSWRQTNRTASIFKCSMAMDGYTPCLGGTTAGDLGEGYCAPGYSGPMCEVCEPTYYFNRAEAQCRVCPSTGSALGKLVIVLASIGFSAGTVAWTPRRCKSGHERGVWAVTRWFIDRLRGVLIRGSTRAW